MHFSLTLVKFFVVLGLALAAPAPGLLTVITQQGEVNPGSYLVTLKDDARGPSVVGAISSRLSPGSEITHEWNTVVNGFAGKFNQEDLDHLRARPDIKAIEEDAIVRTSEIQTTAPWGLDRISSKARAKDVDAGHLNFTYNFDKSAGAGTDVYIMDTGIYIAHPAFEGRAKWGATFGSGYKDADGSGHGTHCAGTAVSAPYGVAKAANVIAVKVLGDTGSGNWSDVISGIEWVVNATAVSKRPSVASMSLSGIGTQAVDDAIANMTARGIHVTVAAGNNGQDAKLYSPARAPSAITVGASTIFDAKAGFSNWGAVVDVFAPGSDVISTWLNDGNKSSSGTSMAAPHVAGLVAYIMGLDLNKTYTAEEMSNTLKAIALPDVLMAIPNGTANLLINNNFTGI